MHEFIFSGISFQYYTIFDRKNDFEKINSKTGFQNQTENWISGFRLTSLPEHVERLKQSCQATLVKSIVKAQNISIKGRFLSKSSNSANSPSPAGSYLVPEYLWKVHAKFPGGAEQPQQVSITSLSNGCIDAKLSLVLDGLPQQRFLLLCTGLWVVHALHPLARTR